MMVCPRCGGTNYKVVDSRNAGSTDKGVVRKRLCLNCGRRWTTNEIFDWDAEELLLWKKVKKLLHIRLDENCYECNEADFILNYDPALKKYVLICEKVSVCKYIDKRRWRMAK